MRRLARYTLNALTVLSLLLCVASMGHWPARERTRAGKYSKFDLVFPFPRFTVIQCTHDEMPLVKGVTTLTLALLPAARLAILMRNRSSARRGKRLGLCPRCNYDLRATPDRCPECGVVTAATTPRG